jgi:hypothetical protein
LRVQAGDRQDEQGDAVVDDEGGVLTDHDGDQTGWGQKASARNLVQGR